MVNPKWLTVKPALQFIDSNPKTVKQYAKFRKLHIKTCILNFKHQ